MEAAVQSQDCWQQEIQEKRRKGLWWKILLAVLGILIIAAVTAAVLIWNLNIFVLDLSLQGDKEITLEFGEDYLEPGVQAEFFGTYLLRQRETVPVTLEGEVNHIRIGTYTVTYKATRVVDYFIGKLEFTQTAQRTVHVVDNRAPEITLTVNPDGYTLPGQPYVEEGYTAIDNYDGDITQYVQRTEQEGQICYQVTDSSGNVAQVVRPIVYNDPIAPTLTLEGKANITIDQGEHFSEPGYSAADNCEGDITGRVSVSGSVDVNTPGVYTLTYSVADSYRNSISATRTVTVKELPPMPALPTAPQPTPVTPNGKVIYLTFDDGPGPHTARLLDILDAYGVKATFFVVNTKYMHLLPRIVSSGHTLAMHSATHDYDQVYDNDNTYFNDLYAIQGIIQSYTGQTSTIVRFPGGSSNTVSRKYSPGIMSRLTVTLKEMGYRYFDWNVDSRDAGGAKTAEAVFNNVINGIGNKSVSIVLQHDIKGYSVDAVESIIQWGQANGYTFLPLDSSSPVCEHDVNN